MNKQIQPILVFQFFFPFHDVGDDGHDGDNDERVKRGGAI